MNIVQSSIGKVGDIIIEDIPTDLILLTHFISWLVCLNNSDDASTDDFGGVEMRRYADK